MGCMWLQRKLFGPRWTGGGTSLIEEEDEHIYEEIDELGLKDVGERDCLTKGSKGIFNIRSTDLEHLVGKSKPFTKAKRERHVGEENFYIPMGGVSARLNRGPSKTEGNVEKKHSLMGIQKSCPCCERFCFDRNQGRSKREDMGSPRHRFAVSEVNAYGYCVGSYIDSLYMDAKAGLENTLCNLNSASSEEDSNAVEHWRTCVKDSPFLLESFDEIPNQSDIEGEDSYGCISVHNITVPKRSINPEMATLTDPNLYIECFNGSEDLVKQDKEKRDLRVPVHPLSSRALPLPRSTDLTNDRQLAIRDDDTSPLGYRCTPKVTGTIRSDSDITHGVVGVKKRPASMNRDLNEAVNTCPDASIKVDCRKICPETVHYVNTNYSSDCDKSGDNGLINLTVKTETEGQQTASRVDGKRRTASPGGGTSTVSPGGGTSTVSPGGGTSTVSPVAQTSGFDTDRRRANNRVLMDLILLNNSKQL